MLEGTEYAHGVLQKLYGTRYALQSKSPCSAWPPLVLSRISGSWKREPLPLAKKVSSTKATGSPLTVVTLPSGSRRGATTNPPKPPIFIRVASSPVWTLMEASLLEASRR